MPQLIVEDFAPQLIWLAITFIALYIIMARIALPRIANVLEERGDRIASDLDRAEQLKAETEKAIADYEKTLAEAKAKAHEIAQKNRDKINAEIERERSEAEKKIGQKAVEAEERIRAAKQVAMEQVSSIASEVAGQIVPHLTGNKAGSEAVSKAVAKSLKT